MSQYLDSNGLLYFWQKIKNMFVAKETGKGLSTNDYTTAEKNKLSGIDEGANNYSLPTASASVLGGVKVGSNLTMTDGVLSATNTTYSTATTSANGLMSSADKAKLDGISAEANKYILPTASASVLGGVKVGSNLTMNNGVLSAVDTTYSAATTSANGLMSSADKAKLDGISAEANKYILPTASASVLGGIKVGTNLSIDSYGVLSAQDSYELPTASASTLGGVKVGTNLSIDSSGVLSATDTTYSNATTSADGLMSSTDKSKLDGIAEGANNYELPIATGSTLGGVKRGTSSSTPSNDRPVAIDISSTGVISVSTRLAGNSIVGVVKSGSSVSSASGYTACPIINGVVYYKDTNTTYSAATTSANGLMSSADKSKLDAFGAASTYALKTDITGVYKYKGSVAAYSNLPSTGVTTGDVYNVESNGQNYAWTGTEWDSLGEIFQITDISNSDIDTILAS